MTSLQNTLLSVIIPSFNAQAYLAETIKSVLDQNWMPLEILLIDDGSTDDTIRVAEKFCDHIKIFKGPHQGLAATRNLGMSKAVGDFYIHLDSDDLLTPNSISILMQNLQAEHDMITGKFESFVSPELAEHQKQRYAPPHGPQRGHLPGTTLVRASTFKRFGDLDPSFGARADLEWWIRVRDQGANIGMLDDILLLRRIHGNNMSLRDQESQTMNTLKTIRETLKRKRS